MAADSFTFTYSFLTGQISFKSTREQQDESARLGICLAIHRERKIGDAQSSRSYEVPMEVAG